ncbi:hypothetical protein H9N25_08535 [Pedobacter riviphilus]|uniref:Colicin import membrane protein n=1 Tax=Pedobacter riviphilus TaxID=2766984 RepID=A0ABX6TLJ3_9SPHI|nr:MULTISPECIES: hypothetical protein [Pedobacter]NII82709.1 cytoskeletal protein RodZ [Pedobacter sp. SG908]NMN36727.1 cytoskeletal protein RodZ [Pedobacter sp. SG918]QNR86422.1 hypothetical protein H9N25_08535 [Pedobacter riviphilus]
MKKIFSILGSLLFVTAVKAQTVTVKKETVNPGNNQTTNTSTPLKDPKGAAVDPKKEAADKAAAERAIKDAKVAQHTDPQSITAKDPKAAPTDFKKQEADKAAAERAAKEAKIAQHVNPKATTAKDPKAAPIDYKKEAADKAAAERAIKDAKIAPTKGN